MDQASNGEPAVTEPNQPEATTVTLAPVEVDNTDDTDPGIMVSPLQQQHELLKKATGIENNVDTFDGSHCGDVEPELDDEDADDNDPHSYNSPSEDDQYNKELSRMQKIAGIGEDNAPVDHGEALRPVSMNPRAVAATEAHSKQDKRLQQTKRREI